MLRLYLPTKKSQISLAGYYDGKKLVEEELISKLIVSKKIELVIPNNIRFVSVSYVRGIRYAIERVFKGVNASDLIIIRTKNNEVKDRFDSFL